MHKITSIRIAGTDIGQYTILYASDSHPAEINAAKELQRYIYNSTGVLLSMSEDGTPGRENAPEICIGGTNRNAPETFDRQEEAFHIYYKARRRRERHALRGLCIFGNLSGMALVRAGHGEMRAQRHG